MLLPNVVVPVPDLLNEITEVFGEVPSGMTPENSIFPEPPRVKVFAPVPEMRRFCVIVRVWPAELIVRPPVVPPMAKTLFVVSVVPFQVRVPALPAPPIVIVELVPSALLEPLLPILATVRPPWLILTAPLKLLAVLEMVTVPAPDLVKLPVPLITPDRVALMSALLLDRLRLFERIRLLLIVIPGRTVPVELIVSVGVVDPLLVKFKAFPEMASVAVPFAGPMLLKIRLFNTKFPALSLFEMVFMPAAWVALKMSAVSKALTGVAVQFAPVLQFVVVEVLPENV